MRRHLAKGAPRGCPGGIKQALGAFETAFRPGLVEKLHFGNLAGSRAVLQTLNS